MLNKLQHIYKKLPTINCQQKCQEACGPIMMTKIEKNILRNELGYNPCMQLDKKHFIMMDEKNKLICPLLKDGLCSVYESRPMVCRLFGLVKKMACPFGCIPSRWLSDKEAEAIFKEMNRIKK